MRSLITRRLQTTLSTATKAAIHTHKQNTNILPKYIHTISNTKQSLFRNLRVINSSSQLIQIWNQQKNNYCMKHQEIEGPTVERDTSDLANEAREVTESTMKTMYDVSKVVAILGLSQLGIGAYLMTSSLNSGNLLVMSASAVAFGFPFSMALMMRHSLKAMHFFNKMEKIGRLQLLTSTMQIMKNLRVFFIRLRVIGYASVSGLLVSFVYSLVTTTSTAISTATSTTTSTATS